MRDVAYEPLLRVPIADDEGDADGEAVYALYAAVIHSGRYLRRMDAFVFCFINYMPIPVDNKWEYRHSH